MNTQSFPQFRTGRAAPVAAALGAVLMLAGCASDPDAYVVSSPPPQTVIVQQQPQVIAATPTTTGTIVVTQAPPAAPQQEVVMARTARPSSDHVWIEGHWTVRNGRYEWIPGAWERPPRSGSTWIAPRWERRSDGSYVFYESYWN